MPNGAEMKGARLKKKPTRQILTGSNQILEPRVSNHYLPESQV